MVPFGDYLTVAWFSVRCWMLVKVRDDSVWIIIRVARIMGVIFN